MALFASKWFVYCQKVENEMIISQIVEVTEACDNKGDRLSKNQQTVASTKPVLI